MDSNNWFSMFFKGLDESISDREDIITYCKNKNTGSFYEVTKSKLPIEFLENNVYSEIVLYMCNEKQTNNRVCFELNKQNTFDFYTLRNIFEYIEIQKQNSVEWIRAKPHHIEAYHTYSAYTKLNANHSTQHSPFFSTKYYQVVMFLSKHTKSISIQHRLSVDIIQDQYEAVHTRKEKAMFQASSLFNYLQAPTETMYPSDGIRHYIFNTTDQGSHCALVSPHATLFRNWIINSDDNQQNGLSNIIHRNKLYKYIDINNGYASLTSYAKQNIVNGYGISQNNDHIINTYSQTLQENITNDLCIGITRTPIELKCHPLKGKSERKRNQEEEEELVSVTAWCSCFPLNLKNTITEQKALTPLIKSILFASYYLTVHTAVYHPFVNILYLTNIGKKHNIPSNWVMDAIYYALYSFRFAPLHVVILHDLEFDNTLRHLTYLNYPNVFSPV